MFSNPKITTINVGSLISRERRAELELLLDTNHIDIGLLQETHLKPIHTLFL